VVAALASCGGSDTQATDGATEGNAGTEATATTAFREGKVVLQDSFSDPRSGWSSHMNEDVETGYSEGAYRIFVKAEQLYWSEWFPLEPRVDALRLEVDVIQRAGVDGSGDLVSGDLVGVICYTDTDSDDEGYLLGVIPALRGYAVDAFRRDDYSPLVESEEAVDAVRGLEEENQLRVECVASPDGPNVLTLAVNGETLVRAEEETGRGEFEGIGLVVETPAGRAEALFDDLVVTELVPR